MVANDLTNGGADELLLESAAGWKRVCLAARMMTYGSAHQGRGFEMLRRQDRDGAGSGSVPAPAAENAEGNRLVRKAAAVKSRTKALARRLRKGSRMASLTAEISSGIEKVAGYSDRIIESFGAAEQKLSEMTVHISEGIEILRSLSGTTGETGRSGGGHTEAVEDASAAFRRISETLRAILSSIQHAAQSHSEVLKAVQELVKRNETAELISERLARTVERFEIAAVNAALESVKAGDRGAEFGVLAAAAQKFAAAFDKSAGEFSALLGTVATVHRTLLEQAGEGSERIRAIGVMTKGVRNSFDDALESIDALRGISNDIAGGIEHIGSGFDSIVSENDHSAGGVKRADESIHQAVSLMEEQETMFAGAADHAEALLAATGRLAAAEDVAAALDEIYAGTDAFIRSVETTMERLDLSLSAIRDAANEMDLLRCGSGVGKETLDRLAETAGASVEAAERFNGLLSRLRTSVAETLDVIRNVARELDLLAAEGDEIESEVENLKKLYRTVSRFGGRLAAFSVRMECLATNLGVAVARAGGAAGAFSSFPGEFDAVAVESAEIERSVDDISDRFSELFSTIAGKHDIRNWKETASEFSVVITGVEDVLNSRFAALAERNASLLELLSARSRKIEKIRTKYAAAGHSAEEAHRVVNEASAAGENERTAFMEIIAAVEKASTLADDLYPEVD